MLRPCLWYIPENRKFRSSAASWRNGTESSLRPANDYRGQVLHQHPWNVPKTERFKSFIVNFSSVTRS